MTKINTADQILRERWQEKTRKDRGSERRWKVNIEDLGKMIEAVKNKKEREELLDILNKLKENCQGYVRLKNNYLETRREAREKSSGHQKENKEIELADFARQAKHKVIVDSLNILSRLFSRYGLDNSWRDNFVSQDQIGDWAFEMGKDLNQELSKED